MRCEVTLDGEPFAFELEGEFSWGEDIVLYREDESVISASSWCDRGYTIVPILSQEEHSRILEHTRHLLWDVLSELGITGLPGLDEFDLCKYHRYVTDDVHQQVITRTRSLTYAEFCIDSKLICARMSEALGRRVEDRNPGLEKEIVILRISRPHRLDINPPHRDGYLDIWAQTVNLWIPLAGCERRTSLAVIPGSHRWSEKDVLRTQAGGAGIAGLRYHVPGVVRTRFGLNMIRPNPQSGEALVFTPFLLHGVAINQTEDTSRLSFELRLFHMR